MDVTQQLPLPLGAYSLSFARTSQYLIPPWAIVHRKSTHDPGEVCLDNLRLALKVFKQIAKGATYIQHRGLVDFQGLVMEPSNNQTRTDILRWRNPVPCVFCTGDKRTLSVNCPIVGRLAPATDFARRPSRSYRTRVGPDSPFCPSSSRFKTTTWPGFLFPMFWKRTLRAVSAPSLRVLIDDSFQWF